MHTRVASNRLPTWLTGRHLTQTAVVLAVCIFVIASAFIAYEKRELIEESRGHLDIHTRVLVQQTGGFLSDGDVALRRIDKTLSSLATDKRTQQWQAHVSVRLAEILVDEPRLKAILIVAQDGRLLASSAPYRTGAKLDLMQFGGLAKPERGSLVGPLLNAHDLEKLFPQSDGSNVTPALTLVRTLRLQSDQLVHVVGLLNMEQIRNRLLDTIDHPRMWATVLTPQGQLLVSTRTKTSQLGMLGTETDLSTQLSQHHASGTYQGKGVVEAGQALVVFRSLKQWPLVVVVETPMSNLDESFTVVAISTVMIAIVALSLLALAVVLARKSLRRHLTLLTHLNQANRKASASHARNAAVLDSALDGILTIDEQGKIVAFNPAAERIFGVEASGALGREMSDLIVPPGLRARHKTGMQRFLATGQTTVLNRRIEISAIRASGEEFPVELTIAPVSIEGKRFFTGTIRDITERTRAQEEKALLLSKFKMLATELETQNLAIARAQDREIEMGNKIQQALLVTPPREVHRGLWVSAFNQASQRIDGDFFDVLRVGTDVIDIVVGDVMGKGVPAALMGAATKLQLSRCTAELLVGRDPSLGIPQPREIVSKVSEMMAPHLRALDAFVTLVYLRIDLKNNTITWVGCGHEESVIVRASGSVEWLGNQQPPIGVSPDEIFVQEQCPFLDADSLFLCSDGAADAIVENGERLGRDRLNEVLLSHVQAFRTPSMALHALRRDLLLDRVRMTDDITMVMLTRNGTDSNRSRLEIPVSLESLKPLRAFATEAALGAGFDEAQSTLTAIVATELVSNIVLHGTGLTAEAPIEIFAEQSATGLAMEINYLGDTYTPDETISAPDLTAFPEGGFGLHIIRSVCDQVEYTYEAGRNRTRIHITRGAANV